MSENSQIKNLKISYETYENEEKNKNSEPLFFRLIKDSKVPVDKFKGINYTMKNINTKLHNIGLRTGEITNLTVIDLDMYKKEFPTSFYDVFGDCFIYNFNTLTQTTPNGGLHLIFQYDEELTQTTSGGIDIRNNGGYVVFYPSQLEGKKWEIIHNTTIKKIPLEFKEWLINNVLYREPKKKVYNKKDKKNIYEEQPIKYLDVQEDILKEELLNLPSDYINNYKDWFYFTCLMKHLKQKNLWDKISKKSAKYNEDNNLKIWDNIDINKYNSFAWTILNKACKSKILNRIQYKEYCDILPEPTEKIEIAKLSNMININNYENSLIIKSDTGTGKTTLFKKYVMDTKQKFISIGSRTALIDEQHRLFNAENIDTTHYKDIKEMGYVPENTSITTTIDSIRILSEIENLNDYILFLDEFNSLIEYIFMADKCLNDKRLIILTMLIKLIKNCKKVIATDADISAVCFEMLNYTGIKYDYIYNTYKHNSGVDVEELGSVDEIIKKILECYENKINTLVCSDTKTYAEYIHINTGKEGTLYTSDYTEKIGNIEEIYNLQISPKMIYGNDSNIGRVVFCVYNGSTITPANMVQQINRERNIKKLYICYNNKKYNPPLFTNKEECNEYIKLLDNRAQKEFSLISDDLAYLFSSIYSDIIYKYDCYNTNKYCHLMNLLINRGFRVSRLHTKNITVNKKNISNCVKEYRNEIFNSSNHREIIDILNLDDKQTEKYKSLLVNQIEITRHFNISEYFFKQTTEEKIIRNLEKVADFPIKKLMQDKKKILMLREFEKLTDFNLKLMKCNKTIDLNDCKKWNNDLRASFGFTRRDLDFTDPKKCVKQIYDCYNNIFGDGIINSKKKKIKGTQKNEQIYLYCEGSLSFHKELYEIRNIKNKKYERCLID